MFERTMIAGWGDMDFNSHMRNTAFLDRSADLRMMYFADNGFPMSEFMKRRIGPVVQKDEVEYHREIHLLEEFRVTLSIAGHSEDGSRFLLCNEIWKHNDKLAARVTTSGGWLDLNQRALIAPPDSLLAAINALPQTENYQSLPSSIARS